MKIRNLFKIFILCSLAILTSATAVSQTPTQPEPSRELEAAAREATEMWEEELSLSAKQMSLMEDKFIEFAIKRNRILQSKRREEVKTRHLIELKELENRDMRDILTKPQYDQVHKIAKKNGQAGKQK
jgi:hypothetical protein